MDNDMNPDDIDPTAESDTDSCSGRSVRKGLTIGLAAGLLGGAAAGFAFGVPGLSGAASPERRAADRGHRAVDRSGDRSGAGRRRGAGTRLRELLQPLVDDGTITAEQADAVVAHLQESLPERGEGRGGRGRSRSADRSAGSSANRPMP